MTLCTKAERMIIIIQFQKQVGQSNNIKEEILKFGRERPLSAQDKLSITLLSSRSRVRDLVSFN